MVHALLFAALWLFIAYSMPPSTPLLVRISSGGSMALGYIVTWLIPIWIKHRHIKSQNRLLDRCRSLLIIGSRAFAAGNNPAAEAGLRRIRRLETLWRLGNSLPIRVSLAIWAIGSAIAMCTAIRFTGLLVTRYGWTGRMVAPEEILGELAIAWAISAMALLHALTSYFEQWSNPWLIENCGDRLWQLMYGPRQVEMARDPSRLDIPDFDGMSPREVFGLPPDFTRRDLDAARRRLVLILHPDRWHHADARDRLVREESLKRVNVAYDILRQQFTRL